MRKILYVLNPASGSKKAKNLIGKIEAFSKENEFDYTIVVSEKDQGISDLVKNNLAAESYTDIVAVGGDGTISEIINGMDTYDIPLGIIPMGTGNDLARSLNIPQNIDVALSTIKEGKLKFCDIGNVNGTLFINSAGVGIDGSIISGTNRIKKFFPGSLAYLISTIKSIFTFRAFTAKIKLDDEMIHENCLLIAIGNGCYFGGGMKITPHAQLDNGQFQVCIVKQVPKHIFMRMFPKVYYGRHTEVDQVIMRYSKTLNIEIEKDNLLVSADGNLVSQTPACISITPKAIKVRMNESK